MPSRPNPLGAIAPPRWILRLENAPSRATYANESLQQTGEAGDADEPPAAELGRQADDTNSHYEAVPGGTMKLIILAMVFLSIAIIAGDAHGQQLAARDSTDVRYYDRWPGVWHRIEGEHIDTLPTFEVRRGPGNSFLENWYLVIDGKRSVSFGLRSWDPETMSWRLIWVSDPGLFQIWDGIKLDDGWYIVRRFGEGADAFLSRQAWIPQGPDRLLRSIERSTDGGRTWSVRYRDSFQRVRPGDESR